MKITTRIALGLFLVAGLLIGALAYQLSVTDRLQGINQELTRATIESSQISIRLIQGLEGVREFAAKGSTLRDPDNLELWSEWEGSVEATLAELSALDLAGPEAAHRDRIMAGWSRYREVAALLTEDPAHPFAELDLALDDLGAEIDELIAANSGRVAEQAQTSSEAADEARLVAWIAAIVALSIATAFSAALFLSISGPLRRLTQGTRELARGRFEHRLKASGPSELASLAGDFNHMAARLSELEDLKREFVSHVSHELKTPLAAIQETIEVFLEGIPGPLTPTQERLLTLSKKSSTRLSGMITNLLEASRIEAGATIYNPALHDLAEVAGSVVEETSPLALEREITIDAEFAQESPKLLCDGDRVRDVVTNLVGNAIKFAPDGSTVRIRTEVLERAPGGSSVPRLLSGQKGPFLLLCVEDEGDGVPDAQKEAIFEKFHQVGGQGRIRGQGVGLGLAISRKIVTGHGGVIWVDDRPGGGAIFRVLLPTNPEGWSVAAEEPSTTANESLRKSQKNGRVESGATTRRGVQSAGSTALLLLVFTLPLATAGCSALPWAEPSPSPASDLPEPALDEPETPEPESVPSLSMEVARWLAEGRARLEARDFGGASESFDRVVESTIAGSQDRNEALWELAMIHLLPESPLLNVDRGTTLLRNLSEESPESTLGLQARWLRQSILDSADTRRQLRDREAQIEELTRALELYRRIDLERRPTP